VSSPIFSADEAEAAAAAAALVERYVAVWNESDSGRRSAAVGALWAADGMMINGVASYTGHEQITEGVRRSFDSFVSRGYRFASRSYVAHHDAMLFRWEMTAPGSKTVEATGTNFILFDSAGRILRDQQFVE
jgi:hypothetical protein